MYYVVPADACFFAFSMDVKKEFGLIIRGRRVALGMSQEVLAERADLHRTYVTDIERGTRNLTLESISRLANALGVFIRDLFPPEIFGRSGSGQPAIGPIDLLLAEATTRDVETTLAAFKEARLTNRVFVVRDGAAALDYIFCRGEFRNRQTRTQLEAVLLGLDLPKVNGLEVLRSLKSDERTKNIKVVVLSGSRQDQEIREAMRLGAAGCIVKPVDFQGLSQVTPKMDFWWTLLKQNKALESSGVPAAPR